MRYATECRIIDLNQSFVVHTMATRRPRGATYTRNLRGSTKLTDSVVCVVSLALWGYALIQLVHLL